MTATIREAAASYILDCRARNLRAASLDTYRRHLQSFADFTDNQSITDVTGVTVAVLRGYLVALQVRGLRPSSVRSHGRVLRAFLNFCLADGLITESPMRRVRMPRVDKSSPDVFTVDEVKALVRSARSIRDRAAVLCLLDTGCRLTEFSSWVAGDIDLAAGSVVMPSGVTKNRTERKVFLGRHALAALTSYMQTLPHGTHGRIWRTMKGEEMTVHGMKRLFARIGERAGIAKASPHRYRRTYITFELRSGADIYTVARAVGHSGIDLLKSYIAIDDDALAGNHAKHGPVDHMLGA